MSGRGPTLVVTSTFPQHPGDHRGVFILRRWEAEAAAGEAVTILAPRTAWTAGELATALDVRRFAYAPRRLSTLTGRFGILENLRERPLRALLIPAYMAALDLALRRAIADLAPRRLVAHFLLPSAAAVMRLSQRTGIPCEVFGHGTDVDLVLRLPPRLRARLRAGLLAASRVALPSHEKRRRLALGLGLAATPDHFVVDAMTETVGARRPVIADEARAGVLYVGRLIRQKGVDDLLRAVALLPRPPVIDVAGDGPERGRLGRLAAVLGLDVRFHGFVDPGARDDLYRRAAVLCVPSRPLASGLSEGSPLVICEARAHGLPVVAAAVGGIPELCRGDAGATLVPPADPAALARALGERLQAPAEGVRLADSAE